MIIISQDESQIINFNNIEKIEINSLEEDELPVEDTYHTLEEKVKLVELISKLKDVRVIEIKTISGTRVRLGEYATEERAKWVLKLILNKYSYDGVEEQINLHTASQIIAHMMITDHSEFQMPKE